MSFDAEEAGGAIAAGDDSDAVGVEIVLPVSV